MQFLKDIPDPRRRGRSIHDIGFRTTYYYYHCYYYYHYYYYHCYYYHDHHYYYHYYYHYHYYYYCYYYVIWTGRPKDADVVHVCCDAAGEFDACYVLIVACPVGVHMVS